MCKKNTFTIWPWIVSVRRMSLSNDILFLELQKGEIKDGMSACDDFMTTTYKPIKETRSSSK